ncbi:MAG: hypothetical protein Q8R38_03590 [Candidatus Omnitrophota bacterium]|nr:hypothetical protein [Candidatus Omnitrophota bacterium]
MKIGKREKTLIYVIGALIFFFLIERFLFSGLRGKANSTVQQIKIEEARLKSGLDIQKRKDKIAAECKEMKPYIEKVAGISEQEIFAKFLKEVEKTAQDAGVSTINLSPHSEVEDTSDYKKYDAEFRAEGSLSQIFNFINKIQNNTLLIKLDKMSMSSKDEQALLIKIEAIISLVVPK